MTSFCDVLKHGNVLDPVLHQTCTTKQKTDKVGEANRAISCFRYFSNIQLQVRVRSVHVEAEIDEDRFAVIFSRVKYVYRCVYLFTAACLVSRFHSSSAVYCCRADVTASRDAAISFTDSRHRSASRVRMNTSTFD